MIGPNGAGKTTVLNMISGFYRPRAPARSASAAATSPAPRPTRIARAGIARTYQTTRLFGSLSVLDNVALRLRAGPPLAPAPAATTARRPPRLLAFVGYAGALDRPAAELPHVDRRLVEIARALAGRPRVLLLDEPAAGLTRADTDASGGLLRRIAGCGIAVVLVEHDMPLVMGVSDHILVMDAGPADRPAAPRPPIRHDPAVIRAYLGGADTPARPRAAPWQGPADAVLSAHGLTAGYGAAPVLERVVPRGPPRRDRGAARRQRRRQVDGHAGARRPAAARVRAAIVLEDRAVAGSRPTASPASASPWCPRAGRCFPSSPSSRTSASGPMAATAPSIRPRSRRCSPASPACATGPTSRAGLLSGGEQQMLAIARGMMARPRILLLDEPSLGLAPAMINALYAVVAELRDQGVTILIVDQMAALALTVADRGYVLEQGRVVTAGTAAELSARTRAWRPPISARPEDREDRQIRPAQEERPLARQMPPNICARPIVGEQEPATYDDRILTIARTARGRANGETDDRVPDPTAGETVCRCRDDPHRRPFRVAGEDDHPGRHASALHISIRSSTTAHITRNHGYMVYDTLLSMNSKQRAAAADGLLSSRPPTTS